MTIKSTHKFCCNLCGKTKEQETKSMPDGWLNFLIENLYVDRDFSEKHICKCCAKEIAERYEKAKSS